MNSTSRQCAALAGPFLHIHDNNDSGILWAVFSLLSIVLTCFTRRLVLGYVTNRTPPTKPTPTAAAIPTPCPRCQHIPDADLPQPLAPLSELPLPPPPPPAKLPPTYQEILAADKKRLAAVPTIPRFILCTILTLANITALIFTAFSIQAMLYCSIEVKQGKPVTTPEPLASVICLWLVYAGISVAWASCGILCWPIWVRNLLGGEESAEKWPIWTEVLGMVLVGAILGPPFLLSVFVCLIIFLILGIVTGVINLLWQKVRGKLMVVLDGNEAERGLGCESSSSSSVTQVESLVEK